jgi:carboxyl-terminal processing protease
MLPNDVLWIRLSEFSSGATEGMQAALREGKELGATSVILDLRANPGGLVFEAMGVGSQFLPDDSILYREQDRGGQVTGVRTVGSNGEWQESPVIVLIDGDSASAAEIVSSALRDNERAELVGKTTYGTGTVLLPIDLEDGSSVLIGTDLWLTADGEEIWKKGVEPTIEVENEVGVSPKFPYLYENNQVTEAQLGEMPDAQLLKAYEEITNATAP